MLHPPGFGDLEDASKSGPAENAHPSFISGRLQEASEAARGLGGCKRPRRLQEACFVQIGPIAVIALAARRYEDVRPISASSHAHEI